MATEWTILKEDGAKKEASLRRSILMLRLRRATKVSYTRVPKQLKLVAMNLKLRSP
jgi:hypothetical protein